MGILALNRVITVRNDLKHMMHDLDVLNTLLKEDLYAIGEIIAVGEVANHFILFKPPHPEDGEGWREGVPEDEQ